MPHPRWSRRHSLFSDMSNSNPFTTTFAIDRDDRARPTRCREAGAFTQTVNSAVG
jgi:hypothetical protein